MVGRKRRHSLIEVLIEVFSPLLSKRHVLKKKNMKEMFGERIFYYIMRIF